jgi:tetratricopeptide (TPR) repeat protein
MQKGSLNHFALNRDQRLVGAVGPRNKFCIEMISTQDINMPAASISSYRTTLRPLVRRLKCVAVLAIATGGLHAAPAIADMANECKSESDAGKRIAACSSLIGSGSVKGAELALAYIQRGMAFQNQALYDKALKDYDTALGLVPASAAARFQRGMTRVSQKNYDGALADLNAALEIEPAMVRALSERAYVWHKKNDSAKALVDVTAALKLEPNHAPGYYVRALIYEGRGDIALALEDFSKAITLKPRPLYYFQRGEALAEKGDKAAAIADFKKTLELDPKHEAAAKMLANMGVAASPAPLVVKPPPASPSSAPPASAPKTANTKPPEPSSDTKPEVKPEPPKSIADMDYPTAVAELSKVIDQAAKANPATPAKEWAEMYLARAGLHFKNAHKDLALADVEAALKLDASGIAYALRAAMFMDTDLTASIHDADEAVKRDSKSWEVVSICSTVFLLDALQTYKKGPREASFSKFEKLKALDAENQSGSAGWFEAAKTGAIVIEGNKFSFEANGSNGNMTYNPQ